MKVVTVMKTASAACRVIFTVTTVTIFLIWVGVMFWLDLRDMPHRNPNPPDLSWLAFL